MKLADKLRAVHHSFCTAVVVAAGTSERMGEDKLTLPLGDTTVLGMTLRTLDLSPTVDELIVVTREEKLDEVAQLAKTLGLKKLKKMILGGDTRTRSALNGVLEADRRAKIICIHDAARPLVTEEIIADAVHNAVLHTAAAPAVPVKDTVKQAKGGSVKKTLKREELFAVQTPQAFRAEIIKGALLKAQQSGKQYTDDCAAAEAFGAKVHLSLGSEENIKLTTPLDMDLARFILERRGAQK